MSNGPFPVPRPVNEPVLGYAPGSLRSAEATDAARAADVSDLLVVARILA